MSHPPQKDLVVLVADKDMLLSVNALLNRREALSIRPIRFATYAHPDHDPGCLLHAPDFLQPFSRQYRYALVLFDHEGSGHEQRSREELETDVEHRLSTCGWDQRCAAVVIAPELEAWVWGDSTNIDHALGWDGQIPDLRTWMTSAGLLASRRSKPVRPKEAMDQALRRVRKPRSAAIFADLAGNVSFKRCADPAFVKFHATLQRWFGIAPA